MDDARLKCLSYTVWVAQVAYRADVDPVDDMIAMCELTDDSYAEVSEFYEVVTAKDPWIFKQVYGEKAFETFKEVSAEAVKRTQLYEAKTLRDIPMK
ncbi:MULTISPECIES: hypothetical protein [Rhizobium/Agrobacterium group]|uniref:hypothetical protein n=1 Tax=Rhizobium/Agrobacterium group TaxID=227290 RepID=UPI0022FFC5AF|nr:MULTISPECIES: hypothetical protein [Rhizobium/Agrobacterium group]MDA5633141.1 hypothetical protein [Agrobacterium sp. ST15.16.024]MDF1890931.1 hypothetical protein [Rhizobium rhizogenes]